MALIQRRPLASARAVVLTNGYAGSNALALGLTEALGLAARAFTAPRDGVTGWLAPYGAANLKALPTPLSTALQEADLLVSVGRTAVPLAAAIKQARGQSVFAVHLQDPRARRTVFDLIWAPEHDGLSGDNVISTPTSPHRITPERIAASRPAAEALCPAGKGPVLAALIGGPNKALRFGLAEARALTDAMETLGPGVRWLITVSRRTPEPVANHIRAWAEAGLRAVWNGTGENPYPGLFSLANGVLVTSDSVNMTGEAAATGLPVHVFFLPGKASKFDAFHQTLAARGVTRPVDGPFAPWRYDFADPNATLANAVIARYALT